MHVRGDEMVRRALLVVLLLSLHLPLPAGAAPACMDPCTKTVDQDADGRIDAVVLSFDAAIDERALRLDELQVEGREVLAYEMASTSLLRLLLREAPGYDSGETPEVTFRVTGNDRGVASDTVTPVDGVPPVLVSVLAVADANESRVRLRWSEPVEGEAGDVVPSELVYQNRNGAGAGATTILELAAEGSDMVATLDAAVTASDLAEDRIAPGAQVMDAAGNPADPRALPLEGPRMTAAVTDVGGDEVRVFFNVPLHAVPSDGSFNVFYEYRVEDPLAGVEDVRTGGSLDELVLRLNGTVKPEDVRSREQAFLSALSENLRASGIDGSPLPFQQQDLVTPLVDHTAPRVTADGDGPAVLTQDRDRDGLLDALLVRFSEPVEAVCSEGLEVELHRNGGVVPYVVALGPGDVPSAVGVGDQMLVPLVERTTQDPDTGLVPDLVVRPCADTGEMPFEDQAEVALGGRVRGNPVLPVGLATVQEADGAPPVVLRATSQDRDQDGFLDAYVLQFSEPLVQDAFDAAQWSVEGHNVTDGFWDPADPSILVLEFREDEARSSGDLPDIAYAGGAQGDLRDPSGNPLETFPRVYFPRIDDAGPRIVRISGDVGQRHLRVTFSEPVEGIDPEAGGPGRNLRASDFFYMDEDGAGVSGIVDVQHTRGGPAAVLTLSGPLGAGDLSPDGTAGDAVRAVQGRIREFNNDAAEDRAVVSSEPVHLLRLDEDPPGTPGGADGADGVDVEAGVSTARLTFPAVADDAGFDSGAATGYRVYVSDAPLPTDGSAASVDAIRALDAWNHVTVDAVPAVGGDQNVTVSRLCPASTVHLAVEALDDFDNAGAPVVLNGITMQEDTTPAVGDPARVSLRSASHPLRDGVAMESTRTDGGVTWSGFEDPETCGLRYYWVVDDDEDRVLGLDDAAGAVEVPGSGGPTDIVHATDEAGARFDFFAVERPTTLYLHVAARSEGGFSTTFHYPLDLVLPVPCTPENLLLPDVEAVRRDGVTTVAWGAYAEPLPPDVEVKGYQVWLRPERGSQLLREELEDPTEGFRERRFLDDARLRDGDGYAVTAYFTDDLCRFDWDEKALSSGSDPGGPNTTFGVTAARIVADPPTVPAWAWVTLTIVAMLVVGGLVLFFATRHQRLDESWLREDEDPLDPDNPFGPDPAEAIGDEDAPADPFGGGRSTTTGGLGPGAGGLPDLDVTCPACTHRFHVRGRRPVAIVCPNCSASGTLE